MIVACNDGSKYYRFESCFSAVSSNASVASSTSTVMGFINLSVLTSVPIVSFTKYGSWVVLSCFKVKCSSFRNLHGINVILPSSVMFSSPQ